MEKYEYIRTFVLFEKISEILDCSVSEIIDCMKGNLLSEEEAGAIKELLDVVKK